MKLEYGFYNLSCKEEEFEDTKGVIRICKSRKERQNNGQKEKDKQWSKLNTGVN